MDTKTLDERIREKAREDLKAAVDGAEKAFYAALPERLHRYSGTYHLTLRGVQQVDTHGLNPRAITVNTVFAHIQDAIIEGMTKMAEEDAVRAFLERLDKLTPMSKDSAANSRSVESDDNRHVDRQRA